MPPKWLENALNISPIYSYLYYNKVLEKVSNTRYRARIPNNLQGEYFLIEDISSYCGGVLFYQIPVSLVYNKSFVEKIILEIYYLGYSQINLILADNQLKSLGPMFEELGFTTVKETVNRRTKNKVQHMMLDFNDFLGEIK